MIPATWFELELAILAVFIPLVILGALKSHSSLQNARTRIGVLETANISLLTLIAKQESVFDKQLLALGLREDGRHMEIKAWMIKLDDKLDNLVGDFREFRGQLGYAKQEDKDG